jgi:hypothetical protein
MDIYGRSVNVELQQRSVEYTQVFNKFDNLTLQDKHNMHTLSVKNKIYLEDLCTGFYGEQKQA